MFFLIRCVFWLTIVFTTILNSGPASQTQVGPRSAHHVEVALRDRSRTRAVSPRRVERRWQAWAFAAIKHAWRRATTGCSGAPADCTNVAERLSQFARRHPFHDRQVRTYAEAELVPLPPLRPQHRRPRRRLARTR